MALPTASGRKIWLLAATGGSAAATATLPELRANATTFAPHEALWSSSSSSPPNWDAARSSRYDSASESTSTSFQPTSLDDRGSFSYHKPVFPLDWSHDGSTILFSSLGLIIAASGGIGGGGILVPLFILLLKFRPKHAIALSNFTILGGSIANTVVNVRKRHPDLDRTLIDWDLILIMEPLTIFGAVFGSLLSKVLPNGAITASLVVILALMGDRTLRKGLKMWREESGCLSTCRQNLTIELKASENDVMSSSGPVDPLADDIEVDSSFSHHYLELQAESGDEATKSAYETPHTQKGLECKVGSLACCFAGTCALTVLKGGGHFKSPLGFECGSGGYWVLYFASLPWVLGFAVHYRNVLMAEFEQKVRSGHVFATGEVQWDSYNTLRYPALCAISGLLAGLFGVGGGIVKGPLMLEMGILPSVASASAAAMILFTSAAASTSFIAFGLLHVAYGALFFVLGILCTAFGQYTVGQWVKRHKRHSPIVLSIGLVIILSSILVAIDMFAEATGPRAGELIRAHGVCTAEA